MKQVGGQPGGVGTPRRGLSRRQFLAGATAAGMVVSLPALLAGCADDCDGGPPSPMPTPSPTATPTVGDRPRERRHLHFDLSRGLVDEPTLHALGSRSDRAILQRHDGASRARHRALNPALRDVQDAQLTHFVEDVDLPADALQLIWVTGKRAATAEDVLVSMHVHKPAAAAQRARAAATARGRRAAKALAYELPRAAGTEALPDLDAFVTPFEVAVALVFQNMEVMNLGLDQGTDIITLIETLPCDPNDSGCTAFITTLGTRIAEMWPASASGGWAQLVAVTDTDGTALTNGSGETVYQYVLDEEVAAAAVAVGAEIKKVIFDDPQYAGTNWHPTQGLTVIDASADAGALVGRVAAQTAAIAVTAQHPEGATINGVQFDHIRVSDQNKRIVEIVLRNHYLRVLSAFVQFTDADGNVVPATFSNAQDTTRAAFLRWIPSNFTVFGVPLQGDDVPSYDFSFHIPPTASAATVFYGSLGLLGDPFCPEAVSGAVLTIILDIGLPVMSLALGIVPGLDALKNLAIELIKAEVVQLLEAIIGGATDANNPAERDGIFWADTNSSSASSTLAELGNRLLLAVLNSDVTPSLLQTLGRVITQDETLEMAGPLGVAFKVMAAGANVATLSESISEVLACPPIFPNTVRLTQTTTVTLDHDPDDFQFPATARHYKVILEYDDASSVTFVATGSISPPHSDPIVVGFDNVPSGGMVTVDVYLTNDIGCIVGRSTDADGNLGPHGPERGTATAIEVTIKELLVPLNADTRYVHTLKLEYQQGEHAWVETDAPTATRAELCQGQEGLLCALTELTISQRTGMAGYAYEAGGQGVDLCDSGQQSILHVFQNVFLGMNPDRALKVLSCGFNQPAPLVYERLGAADGTGLNFFLEPTPNGVYVKSVVLDDATPFDIAAVEVWGAFHQPPDSLAASPRGRIVVGINRQQNKLEVLRLGQNPVDISTTPEWVVFANQYMGSGTRPGLLSAPVAVALFGTTVLILEDGNRRVQAVDAGGNPVPLFQGGTASTFPLVQQSNQVFLDLAVEGLGFMYVLSYVDNGLTPASYVLDVYDPDGNHLLRQTGVPAARMEVDTFRNLYTLNYESVAGAPRIEPSLSQWEPSSPGCA